MKTECFPQVLLVTSWAPDARYAGAEALRRVLSCLPSDKIKWASLTSLSGEEARGVCEVGTFPLPRLNWRLRGTLVESLLLYELAPIVRARQIQQWSFRFNPQVIWVLPELAAINTGFHLARRMNLPVHGTIYDALETARDLAVPKSYYPRYWWSVKRFFREIKSFDAVSENLCRHIAGVYLCNRNAVVPAAAGIVLPSSVPETWCMETISSPGARWESRVRRIVFCGAMRITQSRWQLFLAQLRTLPFEIEFHFYAWGDSVPLASAPDNVKFVRNDYLNNEEMLIKALQSGNYDAAYLPLWRDMDQRLFERTSLSSKLTSYVASGLPVIIDGEMDSVAAELICRYEAGIVLSGRQCEVEREQLLRLFTDPGDWCRMAQGSLMMCRERFLLSRNIPALRSRFVELAGRSE